MQITIDLEALQASSSAQPLKPKPPRNTERFELS
jgi:hypothetical protein